MTTIKLPSAFQIGDSAFINFWSHEIGGEVCGVHFYNGKVKYDFKVFGGNGGETRIYNIDSAFVSRVSRKIKQIEPERRENIINNLLSEFEQ